MKRLKTIPSHAGLFRFLAETSEEPVGFLARVQTAAIPSPYRSGPTVAVYAWGDKRVVWFETSHKRYKVFEVHPGMRVFDTDDEATDWHVAHTMKAAS